MRMWCAGVNLIPSAVSAAEHCQPHVCLMEPQDALTSIGTVPNTSSLIFLRGQRGGAVLASSDLNQALWNLCGSCVCIVDVRHVPAAQLSRFASIFRP
jgi:hypothetical protein